MGSLWLPQQVGQETGSLGSVLAALPPSKRIQLVQLRLIQHLKVLSIKVQVCV